MPINYCWGFFPDKQRSVETRKYVKLLFCVAFLLSNSLFSQWNPKRDIGISIKMKTYFDFSSEVKKQTICWNNKKKQTVTRVEPLWPSTVNGHGNSTAFGYAEIKRLSTFFFSPMERTKKTLDLFQSTGCNVLSYKEKLKPKVKWFIKRADHW